MKSPNFSRVREALLAVDGRKTQQDRRTLASRGEKLGGRVWQHVSPGADERVLGAGPLHVDDALGNALAGKMGYSRQSPRGDLSQFSDMSLKMNMCDRSPLTSVYPYNQLAWFTDAPRARVCHPPRLPWPAACAGSRPSCGCSESHQRRVGQNKPHAHTRPRITGCQRRALGAEGRGHA
jgi:hypothetical protein